MKITIGVSIHVESEEDLTVASYMGSEQMPITEPRMIPKAAKLLGETLQLRLQDYIKPSR